MQQTSVWQPWPIQQTLHWSLKGANVLIVWQSSPPELPVGEKISKFEKGKNICCLACSILRAKALLNSEFLKTLNEKCHSHTTLFWGLWNILFSLQSNYSNFSILWKGCLFFIQVETNASSCNNTNSPSQECREGAQPVRTYARYENDNQTHVSGY